MDIKSKIFINCPCDSGYKHFFILIVFYCYYFGYEPVFACEKMGAESRIDKIINMINDCDFGIHDLSKTTDALPRYNMPFELGLDFMLKHSKSSRNKILILDGDQDLYRKTISDLNGCDIAGHGNEAVKLVDILRNFFMSFARYEKVPKGLPLLDVFQKTFNLWIQLRAKDIGVDDYEELDMFEIKQEVQNYFDFYEGVGAKTETALSV